MKLPNNVPLWKFLLQVLDALLPLLAIIGALAVEVCLLLKSVSDDAEVGRRCMGMYIFGFSLIALVGTRYIMRRKS